jgi:hypothetical protein
VVNIFQIVLGLILAYLGYQISNRTTSEGIRLMGWIIVVLGVVLIAEGVGIINLP